MVLRCWEEPQLGCSLSPAENLTVFSSCLGWNDNVSLRVWSMFLVVDWSPLYSTCGCQLWMRVAVMVIIFPFMDLISYYLLSRYLYAHMRSWTWSDSQPQFILTLFWLVVQFTSQYVKKTFLVFNRTSNIHFLCSLTYFVYLRVQICDVFQCFSVMFFRCDTLATIVICSLNSIKLNKGTDGLNMHLAGGCLCVFVIVSYHICIVRTPLLFHLFTKQCSVSLLHCEYNSCSQQAQ